MNTSLTKNELRLKVKSMREKMLSNGVTNSISDTIVSKILRSKDFYQAKNIALYYAIKGEIDITPIMKVANKNFYLPRCRNSNLEFVKYNNSSLMNVSKFSIPEPLGNAINPAILDLIYIPALCANKSCYRLGWGMGFYDRFFARNKISAKKIIVLADEFVSDEFVQDSFDYKCDFVLTEK